MLASRPVIVPLGVFCGSYGVLYICGAYVVFFPSFRECLLLPALPP